MTDPLCLIKQEVLDLDDTFNESYDNMDDSHDDVYNDVPYDVGGDMDEEKLKIYIDEALQVTQGNVCQYSGILSSIQWVQMCWVI